MDITTPAWAWFPPCPVRHKYYKIKAVDKLLDVSAATVFTLCYQTKAPEFKKFYARKGTTGASFYMKE